MFAVCLSEAVYHHSTDGYIGERTTVQFESESLLEVHRYFRETLAMYCEEEYYDVSYFVAKNSSGVYMHFDYMSVYAPATSPVCFPYGGPDKHSVLCTGPKDKWGYCEFYQPF